MGNTNVNIRDFILVFLHQLRFRNSWNLTPLHSILTPRQLYALYRPCLMTAVILTDWLRSYSESSGGQPGEKGWWFIGTEALHTPSGGLCKYGHTNPPKPPQVGSAVRAQANWASRGPWTNVAIFGIAESRQGQAIKQEGTADRIRYEVSKDEILGISPTCYKKREESGCDEKLQGHPGMWWNRALYSVQTPYCHNYGAGMAGLIRHRWCNNECGAPPSKAEPDVPPGYLSA